MKPHGRVGRIENISESADGKHANIRVVHGKRKKDKHSGEMTGYHRDSSSITVPKAHAANYKIGQQVHAGLSPMDAEDQEDGGADEAAEGEAPIAAKRPNPFAKGGKKTAKKAGKKKGKGKAPAAPASRIAQAMSTY